MVTPLDPVSMDIGYRSREGRFIVCIPPPRTKSSSFERGEKPFARVTIIRACLLALSLENFDSYFCVYVYIYMIYMYIYDDYIQLDRFLFRVDSTRLNFSFGKR